GHPRQSTPHPGEIYIAGLDIGGQRFGEAGNSKLETAHDSTVLTIARVLAPESGALVQEPRLEVVEHLSFTGDPHEAVLARLAHVAYRPNQSMNFYVDPSEGHDDYLISLALVVEAAQGIETKPRVARGRPQSLSSLN